MCTSASNAKCLSIFPLIFFSKRIMPFCCEYRYLWNCKYLNIVIMHTNNTTYTLIKLSIHMYLYFQSVETEPMDTVVLTTVVVSVWTTLHVTKRLDTVTEDVNPDIPMPLVAKVIQTNAAQHNCYFGDWHLNVSNIFDLAFQMQYLITFLISE